jgi:hypothetical protein
MSGHHLGRLQNAASISGGKKRRSRKTHKKHYRKRNTRKSRYSKKHRRKSRYSKKHTRNRYNKRNQRKHTSKKYKKHRGGGIPATRGEIEGIIADYKERGITNPTRPTAIEIVLKKNTPTGKIIAALEKSNGITGKLHLPEILKAYNEIRKDMDVNHIPEDYEEVENIIENFNDYYVIHNDCPSEKLFIDTALKKNMTKDQILSLLPSNVTVDDSDVDDSDVDDSDSDESL